MICRKPASPLPNTTAGAKDAYWNWHNSESLADAGVDAENVAPGPRYWERMLEAGRQAVADRKEERKLAKAARAFLRAFGKL